MLKKNTSTEQVIDVVARGGLRGRIEKLQREYLMKAEALRIAGEILDADERQAAQEALPRKLLQAVNHRQVTAPAPTAPVKKTPAVKKAARKSSKERMAEVRDYIATHPGQSTKAIARGLGYHPQMALKFARLVAKPTGSRTGGEYSWVPKGATTAKPAKAAKRKHASAWKSEMTLRGKPLTLFLLENLTEETGRSAEEMAQRLADAGSPITSVRNLNGPLSATLMGSGYASRNGDGYRRTAKGTMHAADLRQQLEARGAVVPGGYAAAR